MRRYKLEAIGLAAVLAAILVPLIVFVNQTFHLRDSDRRGRVAVPLPAELADAGSALQRAQRAALGASPRVTHADPPTQRPHEDVIASLGGSRPVLLATMEVPFDEEAAAFAVDAAVECGQQLIVANVVEIPLGPMCVPWATAPSTRGGRQASFRAPAELAHAFGVEVERLRVRSPHPVDALLELVAERQPGLLVFGPDRARLKPRTFRKVAKKIRERVSCLVWLAD